MARRHQNKNNSPGRGTTNHDFTGSNDESKPNRDKKQTGGRPSESQEPTAASSNIDRNAGKPEHRSRPFHSDERTFNMVVDNVPYMVKAVPFTFNGELRYTVSFNGSSEYVFTWDSKIRQLRAINDDSSSLPDNLEMAISRMLQSKNVSK